MDAVDPQIFTGALAAAANSVSIVTASHAGTRAGLTVSSMCSVCAEPPLLLACVNADNDFCSLADESQRFAVNMLEQRHVQLALVFAGLTDTTGNPDRFNEGEWREGPTGSPVLERSLVSLDCEVDSVFTRGTHRVYIGKVVSVDHSPGKPLVYTDRAFAVTQAID